LLLLAREGFLRETKKKTRGERGASSREKSAAQPIVRQWSPEGKGLQKFTEGVEKAKEGRNNKEEKTQLWGKQGCAPKSPDLIREGLRGF